MLHHVYLQMMSLKACCARVHLLRTTKPARREAVKTALAAGNLQAVSRLLTGGTPLNMITVHWAVSKVASYPEGPALLLHLLKSALTEEEAVVSIVVASDSAAARAELLTTDCSPGAWQAALITVAKDFLHVAQDNQQDLEIKPFRRNIDACDESGRTAILAMAADIDAEAASVRFLLQHGSDVNQSNSEGESALLLVVNSTATPREETLQKAAVLIKHDADVNASDNDGCTPIMYAATAEGDLGGPLIQLLCAAGADLQLTDLNGETALMKAAACLQPLYLRQLISSNLSLQDFSGQSALQHCLRDDSDSLQQAETASILLDLGADPCTQDSDGCNALHLAVTTADCQVDINVIKRIANLVNEQGAIDATTQDGQTALMLATDYAEPDNTKVVEILLSLGAAVNLRDHLGNTALHCAMELETSKYEETDVSKLLLAAGADPAITNMSGKPAAFHKGFDVQTLEQLGAHVRDEWGQTALHSAIRNWADDDNDADLTQHPWNRELLEARDSNGQTIAHAIASCNGYWHMPWLTTHDFAAHDSAGRTLLHFVLAGILSVNYGNPSAYDSLIQQSDVQHTASNGQTALHVLSAREPVMCNPYGSEDPLEEAEILRHIVVKLIQAGARVDAADNTGSTPLMLAAADGNTDLVKLLLSYGANVDSKDHFGTTTLQLAAAAGWPEVVKVLIERGADANQADNDGVTPLLACIEAVPDKTTRLTIATALINAGAQVDETDNAGMTPLVAACHTGQLELVQALLTARADPNLAEAEGQTPLIAAAEDGFADVVRLLLSAGADVDATDSDYQTPLMAAAAEGCVESVRALLEVGAAADHCDEEGCAVLMVAEFDEELMDMLLNAGADVNAMDGDEETALFKAARTADVEYVDWLLKHGAEPNHATAQQQTALDAAHLALSEGLSDAEDIIEMLEQFAIEDMHTESESSDDNEEQLVDEPDSPDSLDL